MYRDTHHELPCGCEVDNGVTFPCLGHMLERLAEPEDPGPKPDPEFNSRFNAANRRHDDDALDWRARNGWDVEP
jgi:hypothetical protein